MSSRIINTYEIEYKNGFKQIWHLISKDDYLNILKPLQLIIDDEKDNNKGKNTEVSDLLKKSLKLMFINPDKCFHIGTPLHLSIETGILSLHKNQGGDHRVKWTLIS